MGQFAMQIGLRELLQGVPARADGHAEGGLIWTLVSL
jgi:hypothetical protein